MAQLIVQKKIINEYLIRNDNVIFYEGSNVGYIKSFFSLIMNSGDFDFYALSDQDDIWQSNKLQNAVNQIRKKRQKNDIILFGSTSNLVYDDMKPFGVTQKNLRGLNFYNCIVQNIIPGHTQVMTKKMVEEVRKDFDCDKIYAHDYWITMIASLKGKIIFDNTPYTFYRQHKSNSIGYGKGYLGWIKERIKRLLKNDNKKIALQISYFYSFYRDELTFSQRKYLENFLNQKNFFSRLKNVFTTKFYRQKKFENFLFKLLYLLGGFKN